ncbi:hypothetical protein E3N88_23805 [Mikania micrantha]|uniref:Uncharacterized protein n=1 Tax=Mikania micrantha TaxID=192012 RepID=A0A5N6NEI1_9ASTR|nr:hypothetical protein E3N88_23805 [Mikania micrantha]
MDREVKEETVAVAYEEFGINDNVKNDERGRKPHAKRSSYAPGIAKRSLNQKWDENRVRRPDHRSNRRNPSDQYLYHDIKVLILELYLVNPCVAEQKTLIVLSVDTPFTGRIASPLLCADVFETKTFAGNQGQR